VFGIPSWLKLAWLVVKTERAYHCKGRAGFYPLGATRIFNE
jgi:hypothetical protein